MLLKNIILRNQDPFEKTIEDWSQTNNINVTVFDGKESLFDLCQSLVIIHADHNISRENKELRSQMEKIHKPACEIDINGTMNASISSLKFWLENNNPENVLMVGDDKLVESTRFKDYLKELAKQLN
ncbi:MAG: hypothetical protein HUJ25_17960 [Crocinitomicaceae bacterium]|nr:hypothetical protein [Crocinitomicaceae bacterium]